MWCGREIETTETGWWTRESGADASLMKIPDMQGKYREFPRVRPKAGLQPPYKPLNFFTIIWRNSQMGTALRNFFR